MPCLTPYTEHVIMIGDHKQLKPFSSYIKGFRDSSINKSLFERLIFGNFYVNVLNIQYRMRNTFAELLCPLFYKKLLCHESVLNFPAVRNMSMNIFFLDHHEPETIIHNSFLKNDWEVLKTFEIVRYLKDVSDYNSQQIVVLSPYSMQVESIKKKVSKFILRIKYINNLYAQFSSVALLKEIRVTTVDSFQGLEADIVVLSLVRSNEHGNIGFLSEENRICVAMSRARYGLYVIGNMSLLAQRSFIWSEISDKLKNINSVGPEFPYENNNA